MISVEQGIVSMLLSEFRSEGRTLHQERLDADLVVVGGGMAWLITLSSGIIAVYSPAQLGKAFGLIATGSALGGMLSTESVANIVTRHGYLPVFFLMMFVHPLALAILWTTFRTKPAAMLTPANQDSAFSL